MAAIQINPQGFKNLLPEFNTAAYSDTYIQSCLDIATDIINPAANCGALKNKKRQDAIYYMAAHILTLRQNAMAGKGGKATGQTASSSIGSVSVSFITPPNASQNEYWLNQTIYGQFYLKLLNQAKAGGFYFGGSIEAVLR